MKEETKLFKHTKTAEMIMLLDEVYREIEDAENNWRAACPIRCIDGCGACCTHFEPEIYEVEALYLAAWLLHHQHERALQILDGNFNENVLDKEKGCLLFDIDNSNHCTVYGGRCLICRLFGYSGDRGKDLTVRWRPCKYLVPQKSSLSELGIRQYAGNELINTFGTLPPVMSDFTSRILCFMTEGNFHTKPLRKVLPEAIGKILMILNYSSDPEMPPLAS